MIEFEKKIGTKFNRQELLKAALTHKSFYFENKNRAESAAFAHNEKLEFLGDAVLDLVLSEYLMEIFPEDLEGSLSKKRASLVNEEVLALVATELGVPEFLCLGKGELLSGGEKKPRLLASAYEAIIGAYFIDHGFDSVKLIVRQHFEKITKNLYQSGVEFETDYKTRLQEVIQSEKKPSPIYKIIQESGPAHEREFHAHLYIQGALYSEGKGRSKKQAEQNAARLALQLLKNQGRI